MFLFLFFFLQFGIPPDSQKTLETIPPFPPHTTKRSNSLPREVPPPFRAGGTPVEEAPLEPPAERGVLVPKGEADLPVGGRRGLPSEDGYPPALWVERGGGAQHSTAPSRLHALKWCRGRWDHQGRPRRGGAPPPAAGPPMPDRRRRSDPLPNRMVRSCCTTEGRRG